MLVSEKLLNSHPIISDQIKQLALHVVLGELEAVLARDIAGDITEFGCYVGTTSLFIRRILDAQPGSDERQFHVYDSFAGLPPKAPQDGSVAGDAFQAGELNVSKKQLLQEFSKARLRSPVIHKAWFAELDGRPGSRDVPDTIAFAFLDGDFYDSILDSLKLVWPRLSPGGTVCFDDYQREALPGVTRAVHDYFGRVPDGMRVAHNIGVLIKPGGPAKRQVRGSHSYSDMPRAVSGGERQ